MTKAVTAEISATPRIIRPEPLHAVGDRIPRWRCIIVDGSAVIARLAVGDGAADDGTCDKPAGDTRTNPTAIAAGVGCAAAAVIAAGTLSAPTGNSENGLFHG